MQGLRLGRPGTCMPVNMRVRFCVRVQVFVSSLGEIWTEKTHAFPWVGKLVVPSFLLSVILSASGRTGFCENGDEAECKSIAAAC
eukprot:4592788-Pleurochrysis_carterae.AAC.1